MQPSSDAIDRWISSGIITSEQATQIRADLAAHAPRRGSLVAEALGYLGGVVVLVGLGFALTLSWNDLSDEGRIGVAAGITAALFLAGLPIPVKRLGTTGTRLRGVLWAAATAGAAATLGLYGDLVLDLDPEPLMALWPSGAAVASAALWVFNRHVLQHLTTIAFLSLAAFWLTELVAQRHADVFAGLAVWAVGAAWLILALFNVLPRSDGAVLGALGTTIGGLLLLGFYWGPLFALGVVVALIVAAVALRELAVLSVASVGTLIALPFAVEQHLPGGALSTALALVAAGLALVATGVYTARRRRTESPG